MMKSEEEARETTIELIDKLINDQKGNISQLEIMKEHINDMSSEQFEHFGLVFGYSMAPDMIKATLGATATICAVNDTIVHIKESGRISDE